MESSRRRLLIGGLATLLAAQCLYGILTLATLYKSYKTSLVSVQAIASEKFSLDLSRLARFGKDPERVEDMAERVRRFCEIAGVSRLAVLDGKGRSIAAWPSDASEAPPVPQDENKLKTLHGEVKTFDADGKVWIVQPIRNRTGADVGSVLAGFDEAGMTALVGKAASMHALLFLGVAVLGGSLFILLVLREGKAPSPGSEKDVSSSPCSSARSLSFFSSGARSFPFWRKTPETPERSLPATLGMMSLTSTISG